MYWPAEGFTSLCGWTASSSCEGDLFYFLLPVDTTQCFQMNGSVRNACGFKDCLSWVYSCIQDAINCYLVTRFHKNKSFCCFSCIKYTVPAAVLLKNITSFPTGMQRNRKLAFLNSPFWFVISKCLIYSSVSCYKYFAASLCLQAREGQRRPGEEFQQHSPRRAAGPMPLLRFCKSDVVSPGQPGFWQSWEQGHEMDFHLIPETEKGSETKSIRHYTTGVHFHD